MSSRIERLAEALAEFDESSHNFTEDDVSSALRPLLTEARDSGMEAEMELRAESIAFDLIEDYPTARNRWGTYYGPMAVMQDARGNWFESPSIQAISPEILAYWERRAVDASHPLLKLRYADLVWEFSRPVLQTGADIHMAHIAVDATKDYATTGTHRYPSSTIKKLKRALMIALSTRDRGRMTSIRDAIIAYEDRVAQDSLHGLWGFSFDLLVENHKVPIETDQESRIVELLEQRMTRLAGTTASDRDPYGFEAAALRLVRYHHRKGRHEETRRVLSAYADAFEEAAYAVAPLVGFTWLQSALEVLRQHGMRDRSAAIEAKMRELSQRAVAQMKILSTTVKITKEEMDSFLDELTEGTLGEALDRVAAYFVPNRSTIETQVRDLAQKAPLQAMLTRMLTDHAGRTVATVGSVDDDLESHVVLRMSQNLQVEAMFLNAAIERLEADRGLDQSSLLAYLRESPLFTREYGVRLPPRG